MIDILIRDMMVATASTVACSHGINGNTPTEITDEDIQIATLALLQANARMISEFIEGENRFGTAPVRDAFFGFMSMDLKIDLENVSSFISKWNYPNPNDALKAELTNSLAQDKSPVIDLEALWGDKAQAKAA